MKYLIPLLLCACSTVKAPAVVVVAPKTTVNVPAYLMEPCASVQKLDVRDYSQKEALQIAGNALILNDDCRKKNALLREAIEKAFLVEGSK